MPGNSPAAVELELGAIVGEHGVEVLGPRARARAWIGWSTWSGNSGSLADSAAGLGTADVGCDCGCRECPGIEFGIGHRGRSEDITVDFIAPEPLRWAEFPRPAGGFSLIRGNRLTHVPHVRP